LPPHRVGYSLFASKDLESFCRRIVRYFGLVSTNAVTETVQKNNEFHLNMLPATGVDSFAPQDAWLATLLHFSRFIYRPEKFSECFRAPIQFGSEKNALVFDASDMTVRLPAANAELARQNDAVVMALLKQINRSDIIAQVRASFIELLPSGDCSRENVAMQLGMSERTLQNRLAIRETNYSDLLSETRRELAEQYMQQRQSPSHYRERILTG
jgi:AraC-like DNA-binding protein